MFPVSEIVAEIFLLYPTPGSKSCEMFFSSVEISVMLSKKRPVMIHDDACYSTELQASGTVAGEQSDVKLKQLSLVKPKLATLGSPTTEKAATGDRVGN